jgi:D-aspartate ligase
MRSPARILRDDALALVVGFSIHGLAVARALAKSGVHVHALSGTKDMRSPTAYTKFATVHFRENLNSDALVPHLLELRKSLAVSQKVVLFPTSDRIVKAIARGWNHLQSHYLLSWAHCSDLILTLQSKDNLASFCERAGVPYPCSRIIGGVDDCDAIAHALRFPLVIKPVQPLSSFKALRVPGPEDLRDRVKQLHHDLPFLAQEWIEGEDGTLYSCTTYLDRGKELCIFTSRKLAAIPPAMGQGTIFKTVGCEPIRDLSHRFLLGLDLSGPVAVEFKRDRDDRYWFIETNVGRTEYCVDLAVQSGLNLPYIEFCHALGRTPRGAWISSPVGERIWFDTDKDPACFLRNYPSLIVRGAAGKKPVFPFMGHGDWMPVLVSAARQLAHLLRGIVHRLWRSIDRKHNARIKSPA